MLKWIDILRFANRGNPEPDRRVEKSEVEWKAVLSPEQFRVTRQKGTERAFSSEMCGLFEPGKYACVCCGTELFDAEEKFESGTGWPSFTQPVQDNVIAYHKDRGFGMYRIEAVCNVCDAHLGHVFQDGPPPSGLRYCMNAQAMNKVETTLRKATFGGGCFWCTEAIFQELNGVVSVESGYAGGETLSPTYRAVSTGLTGHAEVVDITYDSEKISYEDLAKIHLTTHNPTTLNKQGEDRGTQYRSIILYRTEEERRVALKAIDDIQSHLNDMIVTEVNSLDQFYPAEERHQDYYASNPQLPYCTVVIEPKLVKMREQFKRHLKAET